MAKNKSKSGMSSLKRFIGNKNIVTVLGFAACIATLVVGYHFRVKDAISPTSCKGYYSFKNFDNK